MIVLILQLICVALVPSAVSSFEQHLLWMRGANLL